MRGATQHLNLKNLLNSAFVIHISGDNRTPLGLRNLINHTLITHKEILKRFVYWRQSATVWSIPSNRVRECSLIDTELRCVAFASALEQTEFKKITDHWTVNTALLHAIPFRSNILHHSAALAERKQSHPPRMLDFITGTVALTAFLPTFGLGSFPDNLRDQKDYRSPRED